MVGLTLKILGLLDRVTVPLKPIGEHHVWLYHAEESAMARCSISLDHHILLMTPVFWPRNPGAWTKPSRR
jgi:hypothetical protein